MGYRCGILKDEVRRKNEPNAHVGKGGMLALQKGSWRKRGAAWTTTHDHPHIALNAKLVADLVHAPGAIQETLFTYTARQKKITSDTAFGEINTTEE